MNAEEERERDRELDRLKSYFTDGRKPQTIASVFIRVVQASGYTLEEAEEIVSCLKKDVPMSSAGFIRHKDDYVRI